VRVFLVKRCLTQDITRLGDVAQPIARGLEVLGEKDLLEFTFRGNSIHDKWYLPVHSILSSNIRH
jgi:hypothetical protein